MIFSKQWVMLISSGLIMPTLFGMGKIPRNSRSESAIAALSVGVSAKRKKSASGNQVVTSATRDAETVIIDITPSSVAQSTTSLNHYKMLQVFIPDNNDPLIVIANEDNASLSVKKKDMAPNLQTMAIAERKRR